MPASPLPRESQRPAPAPAASWRRAKGEQPNASHSAPIDGGVEPQLHLVLERPNSLLSFLTSLLPCIP